MAVLIRKTLPDLADQIVSVSAKTLHNMYPTDFQTYEEAWDNLQQSLSFLADKLGSARHLQLLDMAAQAKAHFEFGHGPNGTEDDLKLGSWLMQDMERVVRGKAPFAYPADRYRWGPEPRSPTLH